MTTPDNNADEALLLSGAETSTVETLPAPAETPAAPEEKAPEEAPPMIDVHPPHHAISTWREFFIHISTICIGLLIAIGLEQGVEALHRQQELHVLEEDLHQETLTNRDWSRFNLACIDRDMYWLLELRRRVDAVREGGDKKLFVYPPLPVGFPGDPDHSDRRLPAVAVWNTARQNQLVNLLPAAEEQMYTIFYSTSDLYADHYTEFTVNWRRLISFEFQFEDSWTPTQPDIRRMSPRQLDEYAELIGEIFIDARNVRRYLQIEMSHNEDAIEHRTSPNIEGYLQSHPSELERSAPGPGGGR